MEVLTHKEMLFFARISTAVHRHKAGRHRSLLSRIVLEMWFTTETLSRLTLYIPWTVAMSPFRMTPSLRSTKTTILQTWLTSCNPFNTAVPVLMMCCPSRTGLGPTSWLSGQTKNRGQPAAFPLYHSLSMSKSQPTLRGGLLLLRALLLLQMLIPFSSMSLKA